MPTFNDLSGQTFGRLTVIKRVEDQVSASGKHKTQYLCRCSCPNHTETIVTQTHLKDGHTSSCGCLNRELASKRLADRDRERAKHGKYNTGIYTSYCGMIDRCTKAHHESYIINYQNKGITICPEWYDPNYKDGISIEHFMNFYNWSMVNGYEDGKSIDRIDNSKGYSPDNCRWATNKVQMNNRDCNRFVQFNGDKFTVAQLADVLGINYRYYYDLLSRNNFNPYNPMRQVITPSGYPVYMYCDSSGNPIPMNAIYFVDQYGYPISESQYVPPTPTPVLWECDEKGFITKPII